GLGHEASRERISSGVDELDEMLDGGGYYRGSSILISGSAGTGKSSLAAAFGRGEPTLYFSLEESPKQILRNMSSVGISLEKYAPKGLLNLPAARPSVYGLEMHLVHLH